MTGAGFAMISILSGRAALLSSGCFTILVALRDGEFK
jgi:hypothetical protein